ncbi:MAG: hypothetical protein IKE66_14430 [Hyphomicrobium sp.]|nr:hypothetical protein [Hyphomicrobium sp.]
MITNVTKNEMHTSSRAVQDITILVESLASALDGSAVAKDLEKLLPALRTQSSTSVDDLVEALSAKRKTKSKPPPAEAAQEVVQRHCRALETALGDEAGFAAAYSNLQNDPDVALAELIALARQFGFAPAKTKKSALQKILARQQTLMTSRAKHSATAGRVAG